MDFLRGRSRRMSADAAQPATIYVGVVNDKDWGGVFVSDNGGLSWQQKSTGLDGQRCLQPGTGAGRDDLAGTAHGIYPAARTGSGAG